MRTCRGIAWATACAGVLIPPHAHAGRPMTTDDASITPMGECQLQSWVQRTNGMGELWLLPACSPLARMEITLGGALRWSDRSGRSTLNTLGTMQFKFLLRDYAPGEWGAAFSLGQSRGGADAAEDRVDARPFNLVTSYQAADKAFNLHFNVGVRRDEAHNETHATWAAAYEHHPADRLGAFVEVIGESAKPASLQTGFRYDVIPEHVSMNFTIGATLRNGLHEPIATIGVNL
jgi:hypothetical protein